MIATQLCIANYAVAATEKKTRTIPLSLSTHRGPTVCPSRPLAKPIGKVGPVVRLCHNHNLAAKTNRQMIYVAITT